MNARKNAAAPDRRRTENSTEEPLENVVPASPADAAEVQPAGNVTAFPQPHPGGLSNRALNVLKMLSAELMGECPPREAWTPSSALLRRVTFKHLSTARNCGPQTIHEIIQWAASLGVTIRPPSLAGRSLSATWKELGTRFAAAELPYADMAEALEKIGSTQKHDHPGRDPEDPAAVPQYGRQAIPDLKTRPRPQASGHWMTCPLADDTDGWAVTAGMRMVASNRARRRPGNARDDHASNDRATSDAVNYAALARFRYELRKFQAFSNAAAKTAGLTPQQHQALLAVRGFSDQGPISVGDLAAFLLIRPHTAVELVDRMTRLELLTRVVDDSDGRRVLVKLTKEGEGRLQKLSQTNLKELRAVGSTLTRMLENFRNP